MSAPKIFLDCGAYGAWKHGITLDLDQYMSYVKLNQPLFHSYLNLDIIPGTDGSERAATQSYQNQQRMKDAGLSPMPVFHRGDDFKFLERYLADGETSIALAVLPWDVPEHVKVSWLSQCFSLITVQGRPAVATHGLAITGRRLLHRFPFTTADSRTWLLSGALGKIMVPLCIDGRFDYRRRPTNLTLTDRSAGRSDHIDKVGGFVLDRVKQFLQEEVGIELEQARYNHRARQRALVVYFKKVALSSGTEVVFVSDASDRSLYKVLTDCAAQHWLLSYYDLKDQPPGTLHNCVTGRSAPRAARPRPARPWSDRYCDERKLALFELLQEWEGRSEE